MFSYQRNFGVPTEIVTPEKYHEMTSHPQTAWLVNKHREVKPQVTDEKWLSDEDFLAFRRKMLNHKDKKKAEAFGKLEPMKQVAAWCDDLKKRLPGMIYMAMFNETINSKGKLGRWRCNKGACLTGLIVLDIDHVENPRKVYDSWLKVHGDLNQLGILQVYVTPGGQGLKVVFKARTEWGNLIGNMKEMAKKLNVKADESCKDASRLAFISLESDILFINEKELFEYENKAYAETFNGEYRYGNSSASVPAATTGATEAASEAASEGTAEGSEVKTYHGVPYAKIVEAWVGDNPPAQGDRHKTGVTLAYDLRYIIDEKETVEKVLLQTPFIKEIVEERNEDVALMVSSAWKWDMNKYMPKRLKAALEKVLPATERSGLTPSSVGQGEDSLPLQDWGAQIIALQGDFPCLKEIGSGLDIRAMPAALFTAATFMGTLMTRCTYHFYDRPEKSRRLNYCTIIIGDPAVGKSFATRLYKLLAAPLIAVDQAGNDAINRYKKELKARGTSSKEQKKDALRPPEPIIRIHGPRTANGVFIEDMNNAVEIVDGHPMHLHMLTFDSELDSSTTAAKGGQWIDKSTMELKAFHNEEDNQQYRNMDSVNGPFDVFWNFVYTGTPLSLHRKVTERNFGSGLSTRLAVIPMPPTQYKMMELRQHTRIDHEADEMLKTWAFRLDQVHGELPLWPLVEESWHWCNDKMEIAGFNDDKADELLLKRVPYYGICVPAPFILMRHWEEWKAKQTFEVDDKDRELCRLVMDIQYRCQHHFFGAYAQAYFDNMHRDAATNRKRTTKYEQCYQLLPQEFTTKDVMEKFGLKVRAANSAVTRFLKDKVIEKAKYGVYRKIRLNL